MPSLMPASSSVTLNAGSRSKILAAAIRGSFNHFFRLIPPAERYKYGRHTLEIMRVLQEAEERYARGVSSYINIECAFRHGKSDLSSRRFGVWHLLRNPDDEVMLAGYSSEFACYLSKDARRAFRRTAPIVGLSMDRINNQIGAWGVEGHKGMFYAVGLGGTITGRGAALLVIDDPFKGRAEAESETIQAKVWESFRSDLMTRLAPVHIVVHLANRWHTRDIAGRIEAMTAGDSEDYDPDFPIFQTLKFPAQGEEYKTAENPDGWLFPARFTDRWYRGQRAFMGPYSWSSQAMQEPRPRTGHMLNIDNVQWTDPASWPLDLIFHRGWDMATTEAQRIKDDPDYTVGTLAAYRDRTIYVKDVERFRLSGDARNQRIIEVAKADGPGVKVWVEVVGANFADAYNEVRAALDGISIVRRVTPHKEKVVRAGVIEAPFDSGRVFANRHGPWRAQWIAEFGLFPLAPHDDQVDSLVLAVDDAITAREGKQTFTMLDPDLHRQHIRPIIEAEADKRNAFTLRLDMPAKEMQFQRPGRLVRATWISAIGGHGCVWAHVDADGCLCVFEAIESRRTLEEFAGEMTRLSCAGQKRHRYLWDLVSADDDDEAFVRTLYDALASVGARLKLPRSAVDYPIWVAPVEIDGQSGIEAIRRLLVGKLADMPDHPYWNGDKGAAKRHSLKERLYIWPQLALNRLAESHYLLTGDDVSAPVALKHGDVVESPIVRCLRILAVKGVGLKF
jgi:predicted phage terminase large subunit-like protein